MMVDDQPSMRRALRALREIAGDGLHVHKAGECYGSRRWVQLAAALALVTGLALSMPAIASRAAAPVASQ